MSWGRGRIRRFVVSHGSPPICLADSYFQFYLTPTPSTRSPNAYTIKVQTQTVPTPTHIGNDNEEDPLEGTQLVANDTDAPEYHVYEIECIRTETVKVKRDGGKEREDREVGLWSIAYRRPFVGDVFFYWTSLGPQPMTLVSDNTILVLLFIRSDQSLLELCLM